jgi:hypothetical protein
VRGDGVDQLYPALAAALESDLEAEAAAGEAGVVVGEQPAREAVGGARGEEAGPGRLAARTRAGKRREHEAGVVVERAGVTPVALDLARGVPLAGVGCIRPRIGARIEPFQLDHSRRGRMCGGLEMRPPTPEAGDYAVGGASS